MKNLKSSLFIVLLLTANLLYAAKEVKLSYNLEKGKKYELKLSSTQNMSMEMMGQHINIKQNSTVSQDILIKDKTDEGYVINLTFNRIQLKQNTLGMELSWDSDTAEDSDPMTKAIGDAILPIMKDTITTEVDKYGMPLSVLRNVEVSNNNLISGFESGLMIVYSDKTIKLGESWEVDLKPDPISDMVIHTVYTITKIKGNTAEISYEGTISGSEVKGIKMETGGTITGKSTVDIKSGWIIKTSIHQVMESIVEESGMKIPVKTDVFSEITSK